MDGVPLTQLMITFALYDPSLIFKVNYKQTNKWYTPGEQHIINIKIDDER